MPKSKKEKEDKEWAKRYILDPLTAPEPSQLDGPGTSFFNPRRSLSLNCKPKEVPLHILQRRHSGYPTPPDSASPTKPAFHIHHPKPFSPGRRHSYLPPADWAPADVVLKRSQSLNTHAQKPPTLARSQSLNPSSQLPHFETSASQKRQLQEQPQPLRQHPIRRKPVRTESQTSTATTVVIQPSAPKPAPPPKDRNLPPSPLPKNGSASRLHKPAPSPRLSKAKVGRKPPQTHRTQGTAEILSEVFADKTSNYVNRLVSPPAESAPPPTPPKPTSPPPPLRRTGSFLRRITGTMSYQSPEMSKPKPTEERERRSSSSRKHRSRHSRPYADTIDSLDRVGGVVYHHEGPYDATLAAVNKNKKKSPLEAVKDSNNEAIRATPNEYIQDSLTKHVPLQGTSNIPSGMPDRNGNVLYYEEGADLMREPDAAGGAYRRYDFIKYHPDDLKGKGEPSYSIEKAMKENNGKLRKHSSSFSHGTNGTAMYEMDSRHGSMRSNANGTDAPLLPAKGGTTSSTRRRGLSHGSAAGTSAWATSADLEQVDPNRLSVPSDGNGGGLGRSSSTSHRFADGIKRRFGSLRKK